jgi:MFS transporter, MHS family, proline/betaine transporter
MLQHHKKIIRSCFIGNALEWYEFAIFGYLAQPISALFFPATTPLTSLLLTYGAFATGFIMRPIGAILTGYIGDCFGRKRALVLSILLMAAPTTAIGLLPTYEQIGMWAPLLLIGCRLLQGLSLGGEFTGSIIYLIENAPTNRRGFFGSWADFGSSIGMIAASLTIILLNLFLTPEQILNGAWRIPFCFGLLFAVLGYFMRRELEETPEFSKLNPTTILKNPLKNVLKHYQATFLLAITFLAINASGYYLLIIYLPQQIPNISPSLSLTLSLVSLVAMMPANLIGAYISDRIGQVPCLLAGSLSCFVLAYPLVFCAYHGSLAVNFFLHASFAIALGMCYGPRSSFIVQLFPVNIRFTAVAFSYNIANAIFGGTTPLLSSLVVQYSGSSLSPGYMIMVMAAISFFSTLKLRHHHKFSARETQQRAQAA